MRVIDLNTSCGVINVGKSGENNAHGLLFDAREWIEMYGEGTLAALYQRSDGSAYYLPFIPGEDDSSFVIYLRDDDTLPGMAKLELIWISNGVVAKSQTYTLRIDKSLTATAKVTDYAKAYLDQIAELAAKAQLAAHIGENGNWYIGDEDTGYPSRGPQGPSPVPGVDYWTQEDKDAITDEAAYLTLAQVKSLSFHICTGDEVDEDGVPVIGEPDTRTFYLVPSGAESPDLFAEWVYVNGAWERFGSATIDLSQYVKNTDYASTTEAGVIKIGSGLRMSGTNALTFNPPSEASVANKLASGYAVTLNMIDNAVKAGLVDNKIPLTADEQQNTQSWLGGKMTREISGIERCNIWELSPGLYAVNGDVHLYYRNVASGTVQKGRNLFLIVFEPEDDGTIRYITFTPGNGTDNFYVDFGKSSSDGSNGVKYTKDLYNVMVPTENIRYGKTFTFSAAPQMTAVLADADDSTAIPNTAWVNKAIAAAIGNMTGVELPPSAEEVSY